MRPKLCYAMLALALVVHHGTATATSETEQPT